MPAEERRAAIIEAVRPLLVDYGESVTTKQIACAAGIAEGTIFRVFADKDELLDATLEASLDQEPFEQALREIDPALPGTVRAKIPNLSHGRDFSIRVEGQSAVHEPGKRAAAAS